MGCDIVLHKKGSEYWMTEVITVQGRKFMDRMFPPPELTPPYAHGNATAYLTADDANVFAIQARAAGLKVRRVRV